jgi:thymidylate synthase
LWQEQDLHETPGLAPCAFLTIWNVRGEYLDMMLVQRSGDMLTASGPGGINEVQYAALLMMIAAHTGYKPGVFSHVVANEQIYDRHFDAANELVVRYGRQVNQQIFNKVLDGVEFEKPYLILNHSASDFYSMTIDDFQMINYDPLKPQLKLELGI